MGTPLKGKTTINGGVNFYIWKSHTAQTRETDCIMIQLNNLF